MPTQVQLPDGSIGEFPDGMAESDIEAVLQKQFPQGGGAMGAPAVHSSVPIPAGLQGPPTPQAPQSAIQRIGSAASDLGQGAMQGVGTRILQIGKAAHSIPRIGEALAPQKGLDDLQQLIQPENTTQKIGRGIEQAGEFMIPAAGEEAAAAKVASVFPKIAPLAKMGAAAIGSGLVNKSQGGSFGAGAVAGGIGSGIGQGLKAIAPSLAEGALKIRNVDRAYGKTPGQAILEHTKGFAPDTVASSAQSKINALTPEVEDMAAKSSNLADLTPARDVIGAAQNKATSRNSLGVFNQLKPMEDHLSTQFGTGQAIPPLVPPSDLLQLKRGFRDEFVHNWNPETMSGVRGTAAKTYNSMANAFHDAVPGAAEKDQTISSLIPAAKRGSATALNAPIAQKVAGRIGAHTGALAMSGLGAAEGYRQHGTGGAILGGAAGLIAPELLASPTAQMAAARLIFSPATQAATTAATGGLLQLDRRSKNDPANK